MSRPPKNSTASAQGRYEVGSVLAAGGMGVIHQAYDRLAGREVAYKRLRVSQEADRPRLSALFQREYDTLARLDHPNIVAAYDYGFDEAGPFYAMELLQGDDLATVAPRAWRECCRLLRETASALALIHARRLIHRDVSPNNVRISREGHAKLLDFGALTDFGTPTEIVGTPAFMAPECLTDQALDPRTDLYALGALAYWTLTRRLAVCAHAIAELPAEWEKLVAPPSSHVSDIPRELDELVLSLLQQDRMARPRCAADVIERLTTIADLGPEPSEERVARSYLEHTPLCGRGTVIDALRSSLAAVKDSRGAVLLIEGASGTGRTAVLEQLGIEAQLRGATVLRADGKLHSGPLGLMTHLVQTGLATYPSLAQRVSRHPGASLAPASGTGFARLRSPIEAAEHHARIAASMQDLLLQIADRGPLVLLVDDAEYADTQSLGLLASMSETIGQHAVLLAVTLLSGPATSDSVAVLRANGRAVTLSPLSEAEITELASSIFGDVPNVARVARWLHEESGGAPASCIELVRALLAQRDVLYTRGTFIVPTDFAPAHKLARGAALSRMEGLGPDARQVARLLSLSHGALHIEQLALALGDSTPEVFAKLLQLSDRKLVLDAGGKYALASRALQVAVAELIPVGEARVLHLALARALQLGPAPSLLDRYAAGLHYIRAGGEHELEGALLIGRAARDRNYEIALSAASVPFLEAAVDVFRRHGYPDRELVGLLVPLSVAGFYGDLSAQRRHLDATMRALYAVSGLALATRLRRVLGQRLALIVGILCAMCWRLVRPPQLHRRPVIEHIESVLNIASTGTASAASIMESGEAERIAAWLTPFAAASPSSAMQIARQFCLAVSELTAGQMASATRRLEHVMQALERPVRGMDDRVREQMRRGCLNGLAQANVEGRPRLALESADKLARYGAFFAPHAELGRALYHGFRGELTEYERHRARTETLALRGGVSWSAMILLTLRDHQIAVLTGNTSTLVRVTAELTRASPLGPWIRLQRELAQADLLLLRRQASKAVTAYTHVLEAPDVPINPFSLLCFAMYARALSDTGAPARAKAVCERALSELELDQDAGRMHAHRVLLQQLALAEAELGHGEQARARLDELLTRTAERDDNPLALGSIQHARACLAILQKDAGLFEESFVEMKRWFTTTQNPWLLQQCDALQTRAVRGGLRPAVTVDGLSASDDSSHEMDDSTFVGADRTQAQPPAASDGRAGPEQSGPPEAPDLAAAERRPRSPG